MAIVIVRHGETALNASRVVQPFDTPLSERGRAQAARLAERLRSRPVAALWSSHAPRAVMTAEPISRATGVAVRQVEALQERNFGDIRGRPYTEVGHLFAPDFQPPNGESWETFDRRVAQLWAQIARQGQELAGDLVVVTHGLVCRSLARRFFSLPADQKAPTRFGNTSITVVAMRPPHEAELVNCTAHLDGAVSDDGSAPSGM